MIKSILVAATLSTLLAGSSLADDKGKRDNDDRSRGEFQTYRQDDRRGDDDRYDNRYDNRRSNGYDRRWRHIPPAHYRGSNGYRAGYESGWRDASRYCRADYRPGRWYRDSRDSYWYFGFQFDN